jgi:hypothetical protein
MKNVMEPIVIRLKLIVRQTITDIDAVTTQRYVRPIVLGLLKYLHFYASWDLLGRIIAFVE